MFWNNVALLGPQGQLILALLKYWGKNLYIWFTHLLKNQQSGEMWRFQRSGNRQSNQLELGTGAFSLTLEEISIASVKWVVKNELLTEVSKFWKKPHRNNYKYHPLAALCMRLFISSIACILCDGGDLNSCRRWRFNLKRRSHPYNCGQNAVQVNKRLFSLIELPRRPYLIFPLVNMFCKYLLGLSSFELLCFVLSNVYCSRSLSTLSLAHCQRHLQWSSPIPTKLSELDYRSSIANMAP